MTTLALTAPTQAISGGNTAFALPAAETSIGANTGFSFPNNGAVILRVVVGVSGAGNLGINIQKQVEGQAVAAISLALSNSTSYLLGPFKPSDFNDPNGLVQCTLSVQTGNSVGVYSVPGSLSGT